MIAEKSFYASSAIGHFKIVKVISEMMTGFEAGSGVSPEPASLEQIEFNPEGITRRLEVNAS